MEPVEIEELAGAADGATQLRRRWCPAGPARAAVLLVHGIAEHSGRYRTVGRAMAGRGLDVLAFDNRGHGQSAGRRGHLDRFDRFLDDVEDLLAERRDTGLPVVLFGHSLGGLIAATYVVRGRPAPDLLVLSSPALDAITPRWQRVAAPVLSRLTPALLVPSDVDGPLLSRDVGVQRTYEQDPLRVRRTSARLANEIFTTMEATSAALDRITMPTYAFHGDEDRLIPATASRPLADLPSVTYRLWPGLRHETLNEPEGGEVLTETLDWIDDQLATRDGHPETDPPDAPRP